MIGLTCLLVDLANGEIRALAVTDRTGLCFVSRRHDTRMSSDCRTVMACRAGCRNRSDATHHLAFRRRRPRQRRLWQRQQVGVLVMALDTVRPIAGEPYVA